MNAIHRSAVFAGLFACFGGVMVAVAQQPATAPPDQSRIPSFSETQRNSNRKTYLVTFELQNMAQTMRDQHNEVLRAMVSRRTLLVLGDTTSSQQVGIFAAKSKDELNDALAASPAIKEGFAKITIQSYDIVLDSTGVPAPIKSGKQGSDPNNPKPMPPKSPGA